jgi:hypothetical protein
LWNSKQHSRMQCSLSLIPEPQMMTLGSLLAVKLPGLEIGLVMTIMQRMSRSKLCRRAMECQSSQHTAICEEPASNVNSHLEPEWLPAV